MLDFRSYSVAFIFQNPNNLSALRFRTMSLSSLPPSFFGGETNSLEAEEMSEEKFRMAYRAEVKRLQMQIFFDELKDVSGKETLESLFHCLDDEAKGRNQVSDWEERIRGHHIPRLSKVAPLRRQFAGAKFELHHPVWRWLATPDLDPRTVRRLRAQMPDYWYKAASLLATLPNSKVAVGADLVECLGLHRLPYLDALFLFWSERQLRSTRFAGKCVANLNQIIWLLPVLYADDPMWASPHRERQRHTLALIDYSLGFRGVEDPSLSWKGYDRVNLIFSQQWHQIEYLRMYPQGLRTALINRRYLAKAWRWPTA